MAEPGNDGTHRLEKYTTTWSTPLLLSMVYLNENLLLWLSIPRSDFPHLKYIYKKYPVVWKFAENHNKNCIKWDIS
jgi:hypothetical protein